MIQLDLDEDSLLVMARVMGSLTAQTVSFALRGDGEMRQYAQAVLAIDRAANDIIHASRSGRRDILSPDCQVAKHPACHGDAWNHKADEPTACQCACHQAGDPHD